VGDSRFQIANDGQWGIVDFFDDMFMRELNIQDNLDDLNAYHKHMMDKHNMSSDQFDEILKKVVDVDWNYAYRLSAIYNTFECLNEKILDTAAIITPSAISADPAQIGDLSNSIVGNYDAASTVMGNNLTRLEGDIQDVLKVDPKWWQSVLDGLGGLAVAVVEDVVVDPVLSIGDFFGLDMSGMRQAASDAEQYIHENWIVDDKWYYGGRMVGDTASIVVGSAMLAYGAVTAGEGLGVMGGGIAISPLAAAGGAVSAGFTVLVDGAAVAVGALTAAEGVAIAGYGGTIMYNAAKNMGDDYQRFSSSSRGGQSSGSSYSPKKVNGNDRANEIAQRFGYKNAEELKDAFVQGVGSHFNMYTDSNTGEIILIDSHNSSVIISTGLFAR